MADKGRMEKVSIFCGVCGRYLAAVPAKFQSRYDAPLCRECRKEFHQTTSELDLGRIREDLRKMRA